MKSQPWHYGPSFVSEILSFQQLLGLLSIFGKKPTVFLSTVAFIKPGPEFPLSLHWQHKTTLLQLSASQKIQVCFWDQFQQISMLLWLQPSLKVLEQNDSSAGFLFPNYLSALVLFSNSSSLFWCEQPSGSQLPTPVLTYANATVLKHYILIKY